MHVGDALLHLAHSSRALVSTLEVRGEQCEPVVNQRALAGKLHYPVCALRVLEAHEAKALACLSALVDQNADVLHLTEDLEERAQLLVG